MDSRVKKLIGSNMDIDFISDVKFGDSQCPWNVAEGVNVQLKTFQYANTFAVYNYWIAYYAAIPMKQRMF